MLQTGVLVCKVYKTKKKNNQKKKATGFMPEDGVGGRHGEKSHVGKEAQSCGKDRSGTK